MPSDSLSRVFASLSDEKRDDELDRYAAGREYAKRIQSFESAIFVNVKTNLDSFK
jgi:hypothetical protein